MPHQDRIESETVMMTNTLDSSHVRLSILRGSVHDDARARYTLLSMLHYGDILLEGISPNRQREHVHQQSLGKPMRLEIQNAEDLSAVSLPRTVVLWL
jgi:hypothetical protein